jgi:hypothetical protein
VRSVEVQSDENLQGKRSSRSNSKLLVSGASGKWRAFNVELARGMLLWFSLLKNYRSVGWLVSSGGRRIEPARRVEASEK